MASEIDYKILLGSYQQKSFDLLSQVIALEARVASSNQTIDELNKRNQDFIIELEKAKTVITELKIAELERLEKEKEKLSQTSESEMEFGLVSMPPKKRTKKEMAVEDVELITNTTLNERKI